MRLLFAVVHYYKAGDGRHGSLAADPGPRIEALRRLIFSFIASMASRLDC